MVDPRLDGKSSGAEADDPVKGPNGRAPPDPLTQFAAHFAETKEYAGHFVQARLDLMKMSIRNRVLLGIAGAIGLLFLVGFGVTSIVLVLIGIAGALSAALGDRPWLGSLAAGAMGIIIVGAGAVIVLMRLRSAFGRAAEKKYEKRKENQRDRFGRDVDQTAKEAV